MLFSGDTCALPAYIYYLILQRLLLVQKKYQLVLETTQFYATLYFTNYINAQKMYYNIFIFNIFRSNLISYIFCLFYTHEI